MRSIRVRSVRPLTNGIREARRSAGGKGNGEKRENSRWTDDERGREGTGRGGLFRVGYRHCFTVDENLICTVREVTAAKEEEKTNKSEREKEKEEEGGGEGERSDGYCLV